MRSEFIASGVEIMRDGCNNQKIKDFLKTIEPCSGFVNKYSCECGCEYYTVKIFKNIHRHYCDGKRIPKDAVRWLKSVGCKQFENGKYSK